MENAKTKPILGERLDLSQAYSDNPPDRDDVILGLEAGNVGVIGGAGGVAKSWLVLTLAHDLALGGISQEMRTTLSPSKAQACGFLTAEESLADLQRRAHAIGQHLSPCERDIAAKHLDIRSLKRHVPVLMDAEGVIDPAVRQSILEFAFGKRLVVLDPLARLVRADKCDEAMMVRVVIALEEIGAETGSAIIFSHHSGKGAMFAGNGAEAGALKGSTALVDCSRWVAMLNRPSRAQADEHSVNRSEYRILNIAKSNYVGERDIWFRQRIDGTLMYDEGETRYRIKPASVTSIVDKINERVEQRPPTQAEIFFSEREDNGATA